MTEVSCSKKNFTVSVGIRNVGRPMRKYIHFNEKGKCLLDETKGLDARILARLKGAKESLPGLKFKKVTK